MLSVHAGRRRLKRMMILLMMLWLIPYATFAGESIPMAALRDQTIRVLLSRLGITDRLDITLASPYLLTTAEGTQAVFEEGSKLAFLLRKGFIYLHHDGITMSIGRQMTLQRTGKGSGERDGFYRTHFPALYMGDLKLDVNENVLRPILSIHVEDYLLGVVPYEMSESFPVEALKAQAVAARTYAIRSQNSGRDYDVVDTTNDQVFKGYEPGNPNTEKAIRETAGVCGFYQGKLAQCYYSASNGGQMELVGSVWPTREDFGYYVFGPDPYDVANPESVVRSYEIAKTYTEEAPLSLRELVLELMRDDLVAMGMDPQPESIRIDRVAEVKLGAPVKEGSQLMTQLELRMSMSARTKREVSAVVDLDTEEVSLFAVNQPTVTEAPTATQEPRIVYGPFEPLADEVVLQVPVFPMAEDAFGMDISSNYDNEIWTVNETDTSFVLEARRYGHGVGMSQRGAQWMAKEHGKRYTDILGFYYPGMNLMRYPEQSVEYAMPDEALLEDAGPAPTPTPRPTLMPLTSEAEEGQWIAIVTGISDNSSLNLRKEPNLSAEILMRIYKNQRLLVLERSPEDGWVKVRTDAIEGYVMESYLTKE